MLKYELKFNNTKLKWSNPDFTILIDEQIKRLDVNKPSVLVIDGMHGAGKTCLASHIAQYVESQYKAQFDYKNQVGKGMEKFLEKLNYVKKNNLHVVIYDEAEDFERRGAMSKFNRLLNRVFSVLRATQIMVIVVLGMVDKLEKEPLKKGLVRALINVHDRGARTADVRIYDGGNIFYLLNQIMLMEKKGVHPAQAYRKTMPLFRTRVLKPDEADAKAWDMIDLREKGDILDTASLRTKGLMDIKELSRESGYAVMTLRAMFSKLKPDVVKIGRKNYYYKSILERISQQS